MSVAHVEQAKTAAQVLSALSTESGRHVRFAERVTLSLLSRSDTSPTAERALLAIAALDTSYPWQTVQSHYKEIQDSFAALGDGERVITSAFTDRALRKLSVENLPEHLQQKYLWGIVATGAADSVVSLFRVINGNEFSPAPAVLHDAALALACHKAPSSYPLVIRTANALSRNGLSPKDRESIISGLAQGAMLRIAHLLSAANSTGPSPTNESSPNGKFHHVALITEMVQQPECPELRHRVIDEIGSITHPFYLWNHPLMAATLFQPAMLRLPQFLMEVILAAVNCPDHIAQRKAVQAIRCSYRGGDGAEGEFVRNVLAERIGGVAARMEVERFLAHFPNSHVREVRSDAQRRKSCA